MHPQPLTPSLYLPSAKGRRKKKKSRKAQLKEGTVWEEKHHTWGVGRNNSTPSTTGSSVREAQSCNAAAPGLPYPGQVGLGKGQVLLLPQGIPLQDVLIVQQQQLGRVLAATSPAPLVPGSVRAPALPWGFQVLSWGGEQSQLVAEGPLGSILQQKRSL